MHRLGFFITILLVALFIYGRFIEPNTIEIKEVKLNYNLIDYALKDKIIIHISDLHISRFGKVEIEVLNIIDQINPDLIFLTGDYIQWNGDNEAALKFLAGLKAKHGVFAVMGDYDYSNSKNSCLFCHEKGSAKPTTQHNVIMLRNSSQEINMGDKNLKIVGIDEGYNGFDNFKNIDKIAGKNSLLLVLSHSPLAFDKFLPKNKVFMFSGDTHGGQVKLPSWVFKLWGYEKNVKYNYGLYRHGNKTMYVTRGIGTSHFRFRFFCPPEIAVIRF